MHSSILTLDTLAGYLRDKEIQLDIEDNQGQRFIKMGWGFEMGDAAVLVSVNDGQPHAHRLEITCVSQKTYDDRRAEVLAFLNERNRQRAFSRSLDTQGNFWLDYVGLYPIGAEMPRETFDSLFGGIIYQFQEDYDLLETQMNYPQA